MELETEEDLVFECSVRGKPSAAGEVDFAGECVQGPRGERFLYIGIGTFAGQKDSCWSRRLKIPLRGLPADANSAGVWEARFRGMGKDGGPACGTRLPVDGWHRLWRRGIRSRWNTWTWSYSDPAAAAERGTKGAITARSRK